MSLTRSYERTPPSPVLRTPSPRRELVLLAAWLAWCAWVLVHYFTVPANPFAWRDAGELFPPPHAREAIARAGFGLLACVAVTLSAWTLGTIVLRRSDDLFRVRGERVVFEFAVGFGALSFSCLALAFAGLYRPPVLLGLTIALSLPGVWLSLRQRRRWWPIAMPALNRREWMFAACALAACVCALTGALAPETEYDALWYHLWLPSRWMAAGRPVDIVSEYVSLYPLTWDLLFGLAMNIGGPVGAKLLHFVCLLLVGATTGVLSARWLPRVNGIVAAALTIVVPVMIWEASTAYIDLALAWYAITGVYALVRHDDTRDRRWLLLAAATFGIALAIKNLGLVIFAIVGTLLLIRELSRGAARDALRTGVLFAALAMAVPAPWYVRAWLHSGNPVFPDLYRVFGAKPPERWDADTERELQRFKDRFGNGRARPNLLMLPWDATVHGARYGGTIGPVFLILAPVALLAIVRREPGRHRVLVLAAGIVAYGTVWASPISSLQLRFLVPVVPLAALLAAEGLRRLPSIAWAVTAALLVANLPPFTEWHEADRRGWSGWLTHTMRLLPVPVVIGAESEKSYLARKVPSFRAWQYIDTHVPPGSRVLTFTSGDHLYSRTDRLWSDTPLARPATWGALGGREADARATLARLGITHVLMDKRQFADPNFQALAIASEDMRACCLARIYDDGRFAVYRVR